HALFQLAMIVGTDAKADAGTADGLHIGIDQILLAEMDVVAFLIDGDLPIVVDDELSAVRGADRLGLADLAAQLGLGLILDAQLHQACAGRHQARDPVGIRHDRIKAVEHAQSPNAARPPNAHRPRNGVDGTAMSRGSSGRAAKALRPASMASANALAMATGSP